MKFALEAVLVSLIVVLSLIILQYIKRKYKRIDLYDSKQNLLASNSLVKRRNNEVVLKTCMMEDAPQEWPAIDVCVVTFNSKKWLPAFFESLENQEYPLSKISLYFADNGSSDGTSEYVSSYFERKNSLYAHCVIQKQKNLGFGLGTDNSIKLGSAAFCLITNVDLEFLRDSITNVVRTALSDHNKSIASWELRQTPYEHPKHYDPVTLETLWSSHACILVRREVYLKVGGYDRNIFMYAEDVELSYRFRSFGYALKYVPKAVVIHHTYESFGKIKPAEAIGVVGGNIYMRFRYGLFADKVKGILLLCHYLIDNSRSLKIRCQVFKTTIRQLSKMILFQPQKGKSICYFPFRGFDYEQLRGGHGYEISYTSQVEQRRHPLITVIVRPIHKSPRLLAEVIQSIFNQTYTNIEVIVAQYNNDAVQTFIDDKCKNITPKNICLKYLSNLCYDEADLNFHLLQEARGEYVIFLDDFDLLYADCLEVLHAASVKYPKMSLAYASSVFAKLKLDKAELRYDESAYIAENFTESKGPYSFMFIPDFTMVPVLFKKCAYNQLGVSLVKKFGENCSVEANFLPYTCLCVPKTLTICRYVNGCFTGIARNFNLYEQQLELKLMNHG